MSTRVQFRLSRLVDLPPAEAWRRLADWEGHGRWIPFTRVDVDDADPSRFVAWTGIGPVQLEDRMEVVSSEFDGTTGRCLVRKIGPVLTGEAEFAVAPGIAEGTAVVQWREDVMVPHVPRPLAPFVAWVSARGFALSLRRMVTKGA